MNEKPTHLDLFSGIGGFALAAHWAGFRTIAFCEIDPYCRKVLAKNFLADASIYNGRRWSEGGRVSAAIGAGSETPRIFGNIRSLDGTQFRRNGCNVTLLTGGFPCQPFSCAGKRRGKADDRHLWPEMLRVIAEARPAWVLGENVAGIIGMELDTVLSDLEAIGYSSRPFVIPACGVDARHRRNRVWIVAHDARQRRSRRGLREAGAKLNGDFAANGSGNVPDANEPGSQGRNGAELCERSDEWIAGARDSFVSDAERGRLRDSRNGVGCAPTSTRWQPEPDVGRVAHGIPARVDRLRGLGNSIVPQVAYQIMRAIREQLGAGTNPAPKIL